MHNSNKIETVTRFAPSPTGHLHIGHVYAALTAYQKAMEKHGHMKLRMEDIDRSRCKTEFEKSIIEDLNWIGVSWSGPILRQSNRIKTYLKYINKLQSNSLLYPCFCTRKEILLENNNALSAPHPGELPAVYSGFCRNLSEAECEQKINMGLNYSLRLKMDHAADLAGKIHWHERNEGKIIAEPENYGDVIIARKEIRTSYHLSVVVDDHCQGVTLVTRGNDLHHSTHIHCLLQKLLEIKTPEYLHHELIFNDKKIKLSKRDTQLTLKNLIKTGTTLEEINEQIRVMRKY